MLLTDPHARHCSYLRLSITETCNYRCSYCLPNGYQTPTAAQPFLRADEIAHLLQAMAELGLKKVRFTGGEPTLRRDLPELIAIAAHTQGIETVALTTNGYRLGERVAIWRAAGLSALNVSVDSLRPEQFARITGRDCLPQLLEGIEAALSAGFARVKVNAVLLKGVTLPELTSFLEWIKTRPIDLRFIELMQVGGHTDFAAQHQSGIALRQQLIAQGWQLMPRQPFEGPAQNFAHSDYLGRIGLILPYSQNFCAQCNRLRISARGKLHLCLFGNQGIELRELLQQTEQQPALTKRIVTALQQKPLQHRLERGDFGQLLHLAALGG